MKKVTINSFQDYLATIESIKSPSSDIVLFRGQSDKKTLLPSIARDKPNLDTTNIEKEMLEDLKRRSQLLIKHQYNSDWEWLVLAQHFGLKTRLLDWTSNPLVGLWFACSNEYKFTTDSFVYVLTADNTLLVDLRTNESPFNNSKTKILRPSLNNERIIAQSGWFTAHKFSNIAKRFVHLEGNPDIKSLLVEIKIPSSIKEDILSKLSIFGINYRTIYPDLTGLCSHLNWKYSSRL